MLRFNGINLAILDACLTISIHLMLRFNSKAQTKLSRETDFNTSYVAVQRLGVLIPFVLYRYFNTSYVAVQLKWKSIFN